MCRVPFFSSYWYWLAPPMPPIQTVLLPCPHRCSPGLPAWFPQLLGAQATFIYQNMPGFHSPYMGQDSLRFDHGLGQEMSQTYGVYLGSQVTRSFQAYLDVEMFQGEGLSRGVGLGGYTNGDVHQVGIGGSRASPLSRAPLRPLPHPLVRGNG